MDADAPRLLGQQRLSAQCQCTLGRHPPWLWIRDRVRSYKLSPTNQPPKRRIDTLQNNKGMGFWGEFYCKS
ncbi:hypothetical protein H9L39_07446 [Fusarium oxysporum f. sp. albedinis]|nr:hypothetical protein H9L39_07446 [Fusarium oxysporum f. sp. albedinis]